MSSLTFHSSRPDSWTSPRAHRDASQRFMAYGRIRPLEEPGLLESLLRLIRR